MDDDLSAFLDAMEQEHGYRPRVLPGGVLMHSRDADRYEGWQLANTRPALLRDAGDGWRSIESAPKTGLIVDLWANGQRYTTCYWADGGWRKCDSKMRTWRMPLDFDPTHWRPLPEPPSEDAA